MVSTTQRVADLQLQMTHGEDGKVPGATRAFDAMYRQYGLPGIEKLNEAGYDNPEKLWDFFSEECYQQANEMNRKLNLKKEVVD